MMSMFFSLFKKIVSLNYSLSFILILGLTSLLQASFFLDINETREYGLRCVRYDLKNQKYLSIQYGVELSEIKEGDKVLLLINKAVDPITIKGNLQGHIFRTSKKAVIVNDKGEKLGELPIGECYWGHKEDFPSKEEILSTLGKFDKKCPEGEGLPLKELNIKTKDAGSLGELATELTMISFGYKKIPSVNESNQGFDGVYERKSDKTLFLTESKCRDSSTAKKYMRYELSDEVIYKRLKDYSYSQSTNLIRKFIRKNPQNIFKLVQCVRENGTSNFCLEKFDIHFYRLILQKDFSIDDENDKEIAFAYLMDRFNLLDESDENFEKEMKELKTSFQENKDKIKRYRLEAQKTIEDVHPTFGKYDRENLKKIVKLMLKEGSAAIKTYKKDNKLEKCRDAFAAMFGEYGLEISRGPIDKLLSGKNEKDSIIYGRLWGCIIGNFGGICEKLGINHDDIIKGFSE